MIYKSINDMNMKNELVALDLHLPVFLYRLYISWGRGHAVWTLDPTHALCPIVYFLCSTY